MIAKPRYGVGSRGVMLVDSYQIAESLQSRHGDSYIYQEVVGGNNKQYTTDVLCSLDGQPLQAVTREVTRLKGGADVVCKIVQATHMERIAMELCEAYGVIGAACFEFMFDDQGQPKLIDAQPRLSGGHRVTSLAGLNIPYELVNLVMGGEFERKPITHGLKIVRTLQEAVIV